MSNWKNPIILNYIKYTGKDPLVSLQEEATYLLKKTQQLHTTNNFKAIDVDKISILLGLKDEKYVYNNFLESPARITQRKQKDIKIELNKSKKTFVNYRHRFIIAHEIGHWIIRSKINNLFNKEDILLIEKNKYEEELLCHYFASELLMPEYIFISKVKNKELSFNLIHNLHSYFKVPEYQIINRILLLKNYIGIYWKFKNTKISNIKKLRVINFYPDNKIRKQPFIPINATAKSSRFYPNIILQAFKQNKCISKKILIKNFGDLNGYYNVFVYNPNLNNDLFDINNERKFDLITIIK